MDHPYSFWQASVEELKKGYFYDEKAKTYSCLVCGRSFEEGVIYPCADKLYEARKAAEVHVAEAHGTMFEYFLAMGKTYTGLTEHQRELMKMFYLGYSDKEIAGLTGASNTSTIRNQRFAFREKYKQAKIIVAMTELLEEKKERRKMDNHSMEKNYIDETLVDIHHTATMIDERYAITEAERNEVLTRYFDQDGRLVITNFPAKEKKKIIILQHIMKQFEAGKTYTEKEVNAVIKNFYDDTSSIRRYLIEYGFMDRVPDGSAYWVKQ